MDALQAARLGDQIGHTCAMKGLLMGLVVGLVATAVVLVAVGATVATGGAAAVVIGGLIAGTAGGGLAGMKIGATYDSDPKGPIISGSPNTFLGTFARPAARAIRDVVRCEDHTIKPIAQGSLNVFINQAPAARRTDMAKCSARIREGQPDVFFGGPTGTYMEIDAEVPGWLVRTLQIAAILGAVIATGGAILTVGFGAAMLGVGGSLLGGYLGGQIGGAIGSHWGARGEAWGEALGGFGGSILGGFGGGKLAEGIFRPAELPVTPIEEVQARLTPGERATYQESMRIANEEPIQSGPKSFYASRGGAAAAEEFVGNNPEYARLESGTPAGRALDQNSRGLDAATAREDQRLPWNPPDGVSDQGYGVAPWNRVSARYAQSAEGSAQVFAEGASPQSVFRNTELPELLRNPNVNEIVFRNDAGEVSGVWSRTGPNGTFEGPSIDSAGGAFDLGHPQYSGANTGLQPQVGGPIPIYGGGDQDNRHP